MQKIRIPQLHALLANLKPAKRLVEILFQNPERQNARFLFALGRITAQDAAIRHQSPRMVVWGEDLPIEFVETDRLKRQGWNPVPIWVA